MMIEQYIKSTLDGVPGLSGTLPKQLDRFRFYGINEHGTVGADVDPDNGQAHSSIGKAFIWFLKQHGLADDHLVIQDIWASGTDEQFPMAKRCVCDDGGVYIVPGPTSDKDDQEGVFHSVANFKFVALMTIRKVSDCRSVCTLSPSDIDHFLVSAYDRTGFVVASRQGANN